MCVTRHSSFSSCHIILLGVHHPTNLFLKWDKISWNYHEYSKIVARCLTVALCSMCNYGAEALFLRDIEQVSLPERFLVSKRPFHSSQKHFLFLLFNGTRLLCGPSVEISGWGDCKNVGRPLLTCVSHLSQLHQSAPEEIESQRSFIELNAAAIRGKYPLNLPLCGFFQSCKSGGRSVYPNLAMCHY